MTAKGTVVGMLSFGWISDKLGRKFGMVRRTAKYIATLTDSLVKMSAAAIVALFSALSAASTGSNDSVSGMLAMLCTCRYFILADCLVICRCGLY